MVVTAAVQFCLHLHLVKYYVTCVTILPHLGGPSFLSEDRFPGVESSLLRPSCPRPPEVLRSALRSPPSV